MCLAIPVRILEIHGDNAIVGAMGNCWNAKTTLLENPKVGDLVLVHAGFAIAYVDEDEAKEIWRLFAEMNNLEQQTDEK